MYYNIAVLHELYNYVIPRQIFTKGYSPYWSCGCYDFLQTFLFAFAFTSCIQSSFRESKL